MPELIISAEAEVDLLEIWFYIAEDSPVNADRFLDKREEKALKLCEFSEIGIDRPELAENLKSFPVNLFGFNSPWLATKNSSRHEKVEKPGLG